MKTMNRFKQCMALNAAFLILLGCQKRPVGPPMGPDLNGSGQIQNTPLIPNFIQPTTTILPMADAGIDASAPNISGNGTMIMSGASRYALLKFDLSYLADSSEVSNVVLTMVNKHTPVKGAGATISFDLLAIPFGFNDWAENPVAEATGKPYTEAVTWQNTVGTGKLTTAALATPVLATGSITYQADAVITWSSPLLTQMVKNAITASPNKIISFLVRRSPNSQGDSPYLYSKETTTRTPKMYVYGMDEVERIKSSYNLVWNDEFDGTVMDTSKWSYRFNGGKRRNAYVSGQKTVSLDGNGNMVIKVTKDGKDKEGRDAYYVGQVYTGGKFEPTYGYYECRAKMNRSIGPHVAFWLQSGKMGDLPFDRPDINGAEIDIFEYHHKNPYTVFQTIHINGYAAPYAKDDQMRAESPNIQEGYHTFGLLWTDSSYTFYIDGVRTFHTKFGVSKIPEALILSTELTNWGGDYLKGTYPDSVVFDYVRVYQAKP